jgi:hypothetical protein
MQGSVQAVAFAGALCLGLAALAGAFRPQPLEQSTTLRVDSDPPQAEVWLDGTSQGQAPLTLRPRSGPHQVELSKSGFESVRQKVEIHAGQSLDLHLRLSPKLASLNLRQADQAEIHLGPGIPQRLRGSGPWKLPPGNYEVSARRGQMLAEPKKFAVKPGQDLQISLVWPRLPEVPAQTVRPLPPASAPPLSPPAPAPAPAYVAPYRPPARPTYRPPAYTPPARPYQPPSRPEVLFTPIAPSRPDPPSYQPPSGDEPLFTPLP